MKTVLLALSSEIMGQEIIKSIDGLCYAVWCEDGDQALEYMTKTVPDILVLDMSLWGTDSAIVGITARQMNDKCRILAVAGIMDPYVIHILEQIGACYVVRRTCNIGALTGRIIDLLMEEDAARDSQRQTAVILSALGCRLNLESSRVTQIAIHVFGENPRQSVTGQLYPGVAQLCDGTSTQVEKAIRNCIDSTMRHCDERLWALYFGREKNGELRKPSNKEFLYRISSCVCKREQSQEIIVEGCREKIG